jgi:hypothetical protein
LIFVLCLPHPKLYPAAAVKPLVLASLDYADLGQRAVLAARLLRGEENGAEVYC